MFLRGKFWRQGLGPLICLFLAACTAVPPASPPSSPQLVKVALPPSLRPLVEALHACAVAHPEAALIVSETPAAALDFEQADLVFSLGEPSEPAPFAAPLAWEELLIIFHPDNPLQTLKIKDLQALLNGQINRWREIGGEDRAVEVWVYPEGSDIQQEVAEGLMDGEPITSLARLAPDPEAMLEAVAGEPGAIGFLPRAWLIPSVKSIHLEGSEQDNLRQPVLALAAAEPEKTTRAFLVCLQSPVGQEILEKRFELWGNPAPTPVSR
jgi:hypothetical protein